MNGMHYSDGVVLKDFVTNITIADDAALTVAQKKPYVNVVASAASKSLVLGLKEGETMIVTNVGGTNALTVKAITGDTGTSVAAGKTALCVGSETANASKILVLN